MVEFLHRGAFILQLPSSMQYLIILHTIIECLQIFRDKKGIWNYRIFLQKKNQHILFSSSDTRWKLFLALIRLFTPYLSTILFKNYFPLPSFPLFQMATNELDGCIQIQFEFLWQTQEQKKILGTSKQTQGRLCSHYSPFKIWRTFLL